MADERITRRVFAVKKAKTKTARNPFTVSTFLREDIALPETGVPRDELIPCFGQGSSRSLENVADGALLDQMETEFLQFADNSRITPGDLFRQLDDQPADLLRSASPSPIYWFGITLTGATLFPNPSRENSRRDDSHQLLDGFNRSPYSPFTHSTGRFVG